MIYFLNVYKGVILIKNYLFTNHENLPKHVIELITYEIPENTISIYNPEIIKVVDVAKKFKNDGNFYLIYGKTYALILHTKNNEILETINVFSIVKPYNEFENIQIGSTFYQRFKDLNPSSFNFIEDIL